MDQQINEIIDNTHFRDFDHVLEAVRNSFPDITERRLRGILKNRKHDKSINKKQLRPLMIKIYSPVLNTWFMDIMDNGKNGKPRYWLIFIGTNNRYAVAIPLERRLQQDVKVAIKQFVEEYHPVKLTSDQETSFCSDMVQKYLKKNNVKFYAVPDQNHSVLSIIDRFIRTLRDMNRPVDGEDKQSWEEEFQTIDTKKMDLFLESYNNAIHSAIKMSPTQMRDHPDDERDYINRCREKALEQERLPGFKLNIGTYVRYRVPKDPTQKRRYQYTNESFKIVDKRGNLYKLESEDGKIITKPRFQLIVADVQKYKLSKIQPEKEKLKFAIGKYVRYYTGNPYEKKDKNKYSANSYKIVQKDGHSYILQAKDGKTFAKKGKLLIETNVVKYPQAETKP